MINHPLTVLPRTPPLFAKLGLIRPNPPVHGFSSFFFFFSVGEAGEGAWGVSRGHHLPGRVVVAVAAAACPHPLSD